MRAHRSKRARDCYVWVLRSKSIVTLARGAAQANPPSHAPGLPAELAYHSSRPVAVILRITAAGRLFCVRMINSGSTLWLCVHAADSDTASTVLHL